MRKRIALSKAWSLIQFTHVILWKADVSVVV